MEIASRERSLGALLLALACTVGCKKDDRPPTATAAVRAYCGDDYVAVERRIDVLLEQLTLEQKTLLVTGEFPPSVGHAAWAVGGVDELGIPPLAMVDGPRGLSRLAGNGTAFPVAVARGATFDPELEGRIGVAIAEEVRAAGRNVLLAPTMNVLRHPRWGRAQETYGEDSFHIGSMALGFVLGAETKIATSAKHFAVNSIEDTRHDVDVTVDERTLREVYLPHFRRVVQEGHVSSVMSSYNSVNGQFCFENFHLGREILKDEWQFAGFVVSDWTATKANTSGTYDHTVAAVAAGLDLEMFYETIYGGTLQQAIVDGAVDEADLDEMVRRQLRARFCRHMDTDPPVVDPSVIESSAHYALAQEAAERSITLLRNEGGLLPLARAAGLDVVITGPLAAAENVGDSGSSSVTSTRITSALEGLMAQAGPATITYLPDPPSDPADQATIAAADVVIVVAGLTTADEGEADIGAGDRASLALPTTPIDQEQWILDVAALSDHVVVVLEGGSAITMSGFLDEIEALLFAYYPGVEGGTALARILFGDVSPSGRLPISFPVAMADLPTFDNVSLSVTYGYFHGYHHLDHEGTAPLFPFGFGLGYTTFTMANLAFERTTLAQDGTLRATVDVTNTGSRAGRQTVQLYVGAPGSSVTPRFVRDLRAFAQVELLPGETKSVTLSVPVSELAYWNTAANAFQVEGTTYHVEVGSSSRDLPLAGDVVVRAR